MQEIKNDKITVREIVSGKIVNVHRSFVKVIPEALVTSEANKNVDKLYPVHDVTQVDDL